MDGSSIPSETTALVRRTDPELGLVGSSDAMRKLRREIRRFARLPAPVLVTGERPARARSSSLGRSTPRAHDVRGPFVAVNAGAIPPTLIASELFGHARGAFTGATHEHRGFFQQAHGGTLFLDEVAELPLDLQAWLLRVLETGEVRALGSERTRRVDVRIVCATHVALDEAVVARRFRADLYWRLAVLPVRVPPLRSRKDDIIDLAAHLLASFELDEPRTLGSEAHQVLQLHHWPGNVRELRTVLLRAAATSARTRLDAEDVVRAIGRAFGQPRGPVGPDPLRAALVATHGNISAAARILGLPRGTFRSRLKASSRPPLN
jgi:two-component system response regulator HydG